MKTKPLIIELSSSENMPIQSQSECQQSPITKNIRTMTYPCIVCRKKCSYRCPKCNKNYCSIEHYRSHNLFCSQGFFEKQVKQGLKNTKVTDIQSKKKVVEMVKESWREQEEEELGIVEERLEEILAAVQTGKEVKISEKEQILFDRYVKQLTGSYQEYTKNENEQNMQLNKPYWQIPQGLSIYLTDTPQIEQLDQSQYPQLLTHRTMLKTQLQQFLQHHSPPSIQSQINPTILHHLVQLIYLYIVFYRAYDSESDEFINDFVTIYCSKEYDALLKVDGISVDVGLQVLRTGLKGIGESVWDWAWEYSQIVVQDLKKILNNRLLILQTLLRIMQLLIIHSPPDTSNLSHKKPSSETKKLKKVLKKCEYLLYTVYYKTNNQSYKKLLEQMQNYLLTTCKKQEQQIQPRLLAAKIQITKQN